MKSIQHRRSDFGSNFALRTICVVVAAAFAETAVAQALPTGFNPAAGSSTATTNIAGDTMTVNKTTARAIIDWTTFNVGSGYTVNFTGTGLGVGGAVLNRVPLGMTPGGGGPNISTIAGTVNGTGMLVMLSNPNGILFTPTAVVNVGALVATTGKVDPTAFMSDGTVAISYPSDYPRAAVINQGLITAEAAGLVALVAPTVTNQGVIAATGGKILLAGTDVATISTNGGLYEFAVTGSGTNVTNAAGGVLNGATIYLTTGDLAHLVSESINLDGVQQATGAIVVNSHTVELTSPLQAPSVSGNSDIVNVRKTGTGGRIQDGVNIAKAGGLVNVAAGTFAESVTVGKALTIDGAGMGQTIIDPVGDADGIVVQGNIGAGATVAITDLTVQGGHNGIRVADNTTLGTITLDRIAVRDNASNGFISSNGGSNPTTVANINIRNSVFAGNGFGNGSADINLFRFNGAAQLSNLDILGTRSTDVNSATDFGLQIRGQGELNTMTAAGHVTLDNVRIAGTYKKAHLAIQRYSDASNIEMSNVVLGGARSASTGTGTISVPASAAGWATFFSSDMRGGLAFGNTLFAGGAFGFGDIRIGGDTGGLRIDASQADFSGIARTHTAAGAENFAIEDRVVHALDDSGIGGLVTWQPGNLYVTQASGSIQRGINAACTCDTVRVDAGTYLQSQTLTISKSVRLIGAGEASTIIDARGVSNNYGMLVTGDGVSLSDFTLYGPSADVGTAYGIKVQPAGSGPSARLHDFSISRVTSRGAGRAELDLNGVVGATIDRFTANGAPVGNDGGTTKGAGIQVTDSANVTIRNSRTLNNAWGGVAFFQTNRFFDQQTTNITVENNNTFTESNPIYLQRESTTQDFGTLNLAGFGYAVRNTAAVGSGSSAIDYSQFTWMQRTAQNAFDFAVNLQSPSTSYVQGWSGTAQQSFYVGVGHLLGSGNAQNLSIMTAVDRAGSAGATVDIYPGSYTETAMNRAIPGVGGTYNLGLFVNKDNLTLRGVDALGNPIANADNVQAWITAGAITDFGMAHGVSANNVTFEGLGFKPKTDDLNKTIEIAGDNFTFRNSVVDNRLGGGTTKEGGGGALYFGELDPAGHPMTRLTVVGSKFYDGSVTVTNGVGVALDGVTYAPASQRVISGNRFIGSSNYRFAGVSLAGKDEIGWRPMRIGAVTVTGNSFSGFDESVMVRGEQQGVDLRQMMRDNSFDRSVLVTDAAGNARGETYDSGPLDPHAPLRLKYSIQSSIGAGLNRSVSGDTVAVGPGTYAESIVLNGLRNLTFTGSTIQGLTINSGAAGSGIGGNVTASTPAGFMFNAPVVLLSDTTLATTGANIVFNGDIQTAGGSPFALSLMAGAGDVVLASGGAPGAPLGFLSSTSDDFSLSGTLWVTGFNIGATGSIALSDHSLHGTRSGGFNALRAGVDATGTAVSASLLSVDSGRNVRMSIDAPTGSTVRGRDIQVLNIGDGLLDINGRREVPATLVSSTEGSRVIPLEMPVVRNTSPVRNVAAPEVTPLTVSSAPPAAVGAVLDQGKPVELDLTPGNGRDR